MVEVLGGVLDGRRDVVNVVLFGLAMKLFLFISSNLAAGSLVLQIK